MRPHLCVLTLKHAPILKVSWRRADTQGGGILKLSGPCNYHHFHNITCFKAPAPRGTSAPWGDDECDRGTAFALTFSYAWRTNSQIIADGFLWPFRIPPFSCRHDFPTKKLRQPGAIGWPRERPVWSINTGEGSATLFARRPDGESCWNLIRAEIMFRATRDTSCLSARAGSGGGFGFPGIPRPLLTHRGTCLPRP